MAKKATKRKETSKDNFSQEFERNIAKLTRATVEIDNLPAGLPKVHEWNKLYTDVQLVLEKQFKKEYNLVGTKSKAAEVIDKVGDVKQVRISTLYCPYQVLRKPVLEAKFKNEFDKRPRMLEYNNKFVPFDREDFHILGMQIFCDRSLLGPCKVIDLSDLTQKDFGNALGKKNAGRMNAVIDFLGIKAGEEPVDVPDEDADGNKLTQHQKDLFDKGSEEDSITLRLAKPEETEITIQRLDGLDDRAHMIRATLLSVQRVKAALKNTKDPQKKKNLQKSLKKLLKFKKLKIDKK
jgi:hypothetical protein